jgi:hypothetical protein
MISWTYFRTFSVADIHVLQSMPHIYAATRAWVWPKAATTYSRLFAKSFDAGLG